jgi:transposase
MPSIAGGFDIHRKQLTFDYLDTVSGEVRRGQIAPADRGHLRSWLARLENPQDAAFAAEACTGWRYVALRREALSVRVEVRDLRLRPVAAGR